MPPRPIPRDRTTSHAHLLPGDVPLTLHARWVWLRPEVDAFNSVVAAFADFRVKAAEGPLRLWAGATGDYDLWIDGRWIGRGPTPSSLGYLSIDEYGLGRLKAGVHRVVLLGRNDGYGTNCRPRRPGGLLCQIETHDGRVLAATGRTWHVGRPRAYDPASPRLYSSIGFSEHADLRQRPEALAVGPAEAVIRVEPAFEVRELAAEHLLAREIPPLRYDPYAATAVVYSERVHVPRGILSVDWRARPVGWTDYKAIARTAFYVAASELRVFLDFRCDDAARVKVNGRVVGQQGAGPGYRWWMAAESLRPGPMHAGEGFQCRAMPATLRRGWNPIQVEVDAGAQSWGFMMRVALAGGTAFDLTAGAPTLDLPYSASSDLDKPGWEVLLRPRRGGRLVRRRQVATPHHHDATALSDWQVGYQRCPGGSIRWPLELQPEHSMVVDLGRLRVGFTELEADGRDGAVLDLRYSEAFNALGRLERGAMTCYHDRLVLRDGRQRWRSLHRHGWRYVQVTLRRADRPVRLHRLGVIQTTAAADPQGAFESSDPLLDRLYETSVHTLRLCMQEHWLDCPTREWGQYPGDARVEALQAYVLFSDASLSRKGLRQFARIQDPGGYFRALAPAGTYHRLPDYCLIWVTWLAEHVRHTADRVLAEELYPAAVRTLGWFDHLVDRHGLLVNPPDYDWWLFLDHSPVDKRGEVTGFNAFYVAACHSAAELAEAIGRPAEARAWRLQAAAVAAAMRRRLWSRRHSLFADCRTDQGLSPCLTPVSNVLAVWCGAVDRAAGRRILRRLLHPDGSSCLPIETAESGFFKNYLLSALYDAGLDHMALALMRRYWGAMLQAGCTTWRECFSLDAPNAPSHSTWCHAWSGAPGYFLPAWVLGVRPARPGYAEVLVDPHLADLQWADGTLPSPHGPITIRWRRRPHAWQGTLHVPAGLPCRCRPSSGVRLKIVPY